MPATLQEDAVLNETLFEWLATPGMEKKAQDAITDYTRLKMREDGFYRRIIPMVPVTPDDYDRQVDTDNPCIVIDKEVDSPGSIAIGFVTMPVGIYLWGARYRVMSQRIVTPRFHKDVGQLRTYHMDLRQVVSDNALKDALAAEDQGFLNSVNTWLGGADQVVANTGVKQWRTIWGGITRETIQDALAIMPETDSSLESRLALVNQITVRSFLKWGRDETGGDLAQEFVTQGWTRREMFGNEFIVTIKKGLVPTNSAYFFADPRFIGKSFAFEDMTMAIKREFYLLDFFAYEEIGGAIGNPAGLARADFR